MSTIDPQPPYLGPERRRCAREPQPIRDLETHPEPWLRINQCATYLQVEEKQIWKWHRCGVLQIRSFAPRVNRIAVEELRRFVLAIIGPH